MIKTIHSLGTNNRAVCGIKNPKAVSDDIMLITCKNCLWRLFDDPKVIQELYDLVVEARKDRDRMSALALKYANELTYIKNADPKWRS